MVKRLPSELDGTESVDPLARLDGPEDRGHDQLGAAVALLEGDGYVELVGVVVNV